jgi:hypothetical protein
MDAEGWSLRGGACLQSETYGRRQAIAAAHACGDSPSGLQGAGASSATCGEGW